MALNAKQLHFVKEYIRTKNATRSAIAAGYSKKTAGKIGSENLAKPEISAAIAQGLKKLTQKSELKASDVLAEIQRLAFADLSKAYNEDGSLKHPREMPRSVRAALNMVETDEIFAGRGSSRKKIGYTRKIKLTDKVRALEMLAKHFKLLTEVHEHTGKDGGPMVVLTMPPNGSEAEEDADSGSEEG